MLAQDKPRTAASTRPPRDVALLKQAAAAHRDGDKDRARALLAEAAEANPDNELVWMWRASTSRTRSEAAEALNRALAINPANRKAAEWLSRLGRTKPAARPPERPEPHPEKTRPKPKDPAVDLTQSSADALRRVIAEAEGAAAGDWPATNSPAETASPPTAASPASAPSPAAAPRSARCPVCGEAEGAASSSCSQCGAIIDLARLDDVSSHNEARRERIAQAIVRLEAVLLESSNAEANIGLALAYLNLKDSEKAAVHFEAACRTRPDDARLEEARKRLAARPLILVADDSRTIRTSVQSLLESRCYRAQPAADGLEALAKLERETPNLILLDAEMPRLDGRRVCKLLKGNPATQHIPVVMLTEEGGLVERIKARLAGAEDLLVKPFETEELLEKIRAFLP